LALLNVSLSLYEIAVNSSRPDYLGKVNKNCCTLFNLLSFAFHGEMGYILLSLMPIWLRSFLRKLFLKAHKTYTS